MNHHDLWERIQGFELDQPNIALPFSQRLARDNGWPLEYSQRAIDEYKKFTFLAMVSGHPVTPSDQIDQVWHLHLTYTQSYWSEFCTEVLRQPLHHNPTLGGQQESTKFNGWYNRTLDSYRRYFGEPPADIWPPDHVRFGQDLYFQRVNTQRHWVIPKPCLPALSLGPFSWVPSVLKSVAMRSKPWLLTAVLALFSYLIPSLLDSISWEAISWEALSQWSSALGLNQVWTWPVWPELIWPERWWMEQVGSWPSWIDDLRTVPGFIGAYGLVSIAGLLVTLGIGRSLPNDLRHVPVSLFTVVMAAIGIGRIGYGFRSLSAAHFLSLYLAIATGLVLLSVLAVRAFIANYAPRQTVEESIDWQTFVLSQRINIALGNWVKTWIIWFMVLLNLVFCGLGLVRIELGLTADKPVGYLVIICFAFSLYLFQVVNHLTKKIPNHPWANVLMPVVFLTLMWLVNLGIRIWGVQFLFALVVGFVMLSYVVNSLGRSPSPRRTGYRPYSDSHSHYSGCGGDSGGDGGGDGGGGDGGGGGGSGCGGCGGGGC